MPEAAQDTAKIITAIKPTQRDANRATVRVGVRGKSGKVVATLNIKRINELGLAVGMAWDEALAARVAEMATFDKAMRQAMNRLSRRAMSRRMLDRKLRDLEHTEPVRAAVLARLDEMGLLDDEAFGRALIREAQLGKPAGPALLKKKLFDKGLDHALIDRLVAEATRDDDEQRDAALTLARRRAASGSMARLAPEARHRRLYGQLARRGFTPDVIRDVMARIRAEENADGGGGRIDRVKPRRDAAQTDVGWGMWDVGCQKPGHTRSPMPHTTSRRRGVPSRFNEMRQTRCDT